MSRANEMAVQWECPGDMQDARGIVRDTIPAPEWDSAATVQVAALNDGDVERLVAEHDACTADLGHPCDGGEDGEPCASCLATMHYYRASYDAASPEERARVIYGEYAYALSTAELDS